MVVFSCDQLKINLPNKHRFPMEKYSRLREAAEKNESLRVSLPNKASRKAIEKVHDRQYVERIFRGTLSSKEIERLGFPWSKELLLRSEFSVGCTIAATFEAMKNDVSCSLAGGTHHAGYDFGAGFCVFNDIAIASALLLEHYPGIKILIVDTDVHQGNGTAGLTREYKDIFTLSFHSARNYPHKKTASDLDVSLPDDAGDSDYLPVLSDVLEHSIACHKPEIAFFLAGADVYEGDRLGRLKLSKAGIRHRDNLVFSKLNESAIKIVTVMGGGYASEVCDIVEIHMGTVLSALAVWQQCRGVVR